MQFTTLKLARRQSKKKKLEKQNKKENAKMRREGSCSTLKRTLLLTVVGTEARGTSRDMDNVQMIGTKITAIKDYLYVRRSHPAARHNHRFSSFSIVCLVDDYLLYNLQYFLATNL